MVRASSNTTIFDKGYMPNLTKEHFTVSQFVPPKKETKRRGYKFVDYNNEAVKGSWYVKKFRKLHTTSTAFRKSYGGVLYLTAQKNYLSGGKVGQTSTTRGNTKQTTTMSSLSDEF